MEILNDNQIGSWSSTTIYINIMEPFWSDNHYLFVSKKINTSSISIRRQQLEQIKYRWYSHYIMMMKNNDGSMMAI